MEEDISYIPGTRHKVIGLVSGGKDSCFNLMHCVANGHEMVAIANLRPAPEIDELDSHLYQSVGTQMLPLLTQAMGLPLFTRVIKGKAIERGPEYGSRNPGEAGIGSEGDETEDLTYLLTGVLEAHPEATALASGAILSNYQRLRIEHVCGRLGLVSLSYLWQQPQMPLLESMESSGVEAILVKVAGVGLGIDVVGKNLGSVHPLLRRLESRYGAHPAGEGGEYETLTLSTPLFSHRLRLTKSSVVVTDPEPYPVAYLRIDEAELEEKPGWKRPSVLELRTMLGLEEKSDGLDEVGRETIQKLDKWDNTNSVDNPGCVEGHIAELEKTTLGRSEPSPSRLLFAKRRYWFAASMDGTTLQGEDVGVELKRCLDELSSILSSHKLSLPLHTAHVTLLLSSMSLFAAANSVYTAHFGISPPSRATVAVPLPSGQRIRLEIVGFDDQRPSESKSYIDSQTRSRRALHVQGLSYWAPANIGPYSQAVIVDSRVHVAGQIPLLPASLTLPVPPEDDISPYAQQAVLALQHVEEIIRVLRSKNTTGGGWDGWGEGCIGWWTKKDGAGSNGIQVVRQAWAAWAKTNDWECAPTMFVRAKELPKAALVEFQVNLHTGQREEESGRYGMVEERDEHIGQEKHDWEDDGGEMILTPEWITAQAGDPMYWEILQTDTGAKLGSRAMVFVRDASSEIPDVDGRIQSALARAVAVRVYHTMLTAESVVRRTVDAILPDLGPDRHGPCVTFIPVLEIHAKMDITRVAVALDIFGI